jgi:hypothetical protein
MVVWWGRREDASLTIGSYSEMDGHRMRAISALEWDGGGDFMHRRPTTVASPLMDPIRSCPIRLHANQSQIIKTQSIAETATKTILNGKHRRIHYQRDEGSSLPCHRPELKMLQTSALNVRRTSQRIVGTLHVYSQF